MADSEKMVPEGVNGYYTVEQRERVFLALILNGGRVTQTATELGVSADTIKTWLYRHRPRYEELQRKHGPELEQKAVNNLQAFIIRAEEAKMVALDATVAGLEAGESKSPGNDLKNIAVAQGISVQKVLELSGRPTQIIEHGNLREAFARLRALGAQVDATYDVEASVVDSIPALPAGEPSTQPVVGASTPDSLEAK